MRDVRSRPRLVVLSGMDGAGKSTHARALVEDLRGRGLRPVYRRLRFPFVASVPILLAARLLGRSYEVRGDGEAIRVHAFGTSPLLRLLYPLTLYLDLLLATWILVRLPMALGRTVVCDRFVVDTLIDVASSCEAEEPDRLPLGRRYLFLVPPGTTTFLLHASSHALRPRRGELSLDPKFEQRFALYEQMAEAENVHLIETEDEYEDVHERILDQLREAWPSLESPPPHLAVSRRWYATLKAATIPPGAKKFLLLLTHWLFQSVGSMDRTERALKATISLAVFIPTFIALTGPLGLGLTAVLAALLAHSTNFLLNAHIPVVLKHIDLRMGPTRLRQYADALGVRVLARGYLEGAVVVGSLARDDLQTTSDLDVRVIPKPGLVNALRAGLFLVRERAKALGRLFPLDAYLTENPRGLHSLWESEEPLLLCDNRGALRAAFPRVVVEGPD